MIDNPNSKKRIKVFSYSGKIPAPEFIERLNRGLSQEKCHVFTTGYTNITDLKSYDYYEAVMFYRGRLDKLKLFFILTLKLVLRPNDFIWTCKKSFTGKSISKEMNTFLKYAAVLVASPDIFHLQWCSNVDFWIPLQERGIKVVCSLRGRLVNSLPLSDSIIRNRYKDYFPCVDGFHSVSKALKKEATKYDAPLNKINIIYSGLPLQSLQYNPPQEYKKSNPYEILSIGRSNWKKGYNYALKAMQILKLDNIRFRYIIIGNVDNEEIAFLKQYYHLSSNEVVFLERLPFVEVEKYLRKANILLLPSVEEGIANVVLEAMALGTPVCTTDCGGMGEVVVNRVNGWIVPARDPDSMATALVERLNTPHDEILKITKAARQTVESKHDLKDTVRKMKQLYEQVMLDS